MLKSKSNPEYLKPNNSRPVRNCDVAAFLVFPCLIFHKTAFLTVPSDVYGVRFVLQSVRLWSNKRAIHGIQITTHLDFFTQTLRYRARYDERTFTLAMSTIAMSVLFRSEIHNHPRVSTLRKLAVGWSLCNALLVIAVFYRLMIYVNFNGMTRMRIIGFVGVACVFAGFVIVNFRMVGQKPIAWILHKQTRAVLWSIYLLALLPMDAISHGWNVSSIRSGYLAPAVQIGVQTISDEGLLCLLPLLDSDEPVIKEGVAALLAERFSQLSDESAESAKSATLPTISWTQFQGSRSLLVHRLEEILPQLLPFLNSTNMRQKAMERFRDWSKRWY